MFCAEHEESLSEYPPAVGVNESCNGNLIASKSLKREIKRMWRGGGFMMMIRAKLFFALALLASLSVVFAPKSSAQSGIPDLIQRASQNQDQSLSARDRSKYEQSIHVEKVNPSARPGEAQRVESTQDTVVLVEPSAVPDKTGEYPVNVRVIQDTDDKGRPKNKVDPNAKTLLSFGAVWDSAFYPLLPEKIRYYSYDEIVSDKPNERVFKFTPRVDAPNTLVLAMGTVSIDSKKGEVLTIKIDGLRNLGALDKHLEDLRSFTSVTDYSEFEGKYRFPTFSKGLVVSEVSHFKGNFRYSFEESKYIQVLAVSK